MYRLSILCLLAIVFYSKADSLNINIDSQKIVLNSNSIPAKQNKNFDYRVCPPVSYLAIAGISQHAIGIGFMTYGLLNLNKENHNGISSDEFFTSMLEIDFGIFLQTLSPIYSCIGESSNEKNYPTTTGINQGNNVSLGWKIYSLSGLILIGTCCIGHDGNTKSQQAVIGTGAVLSEACWITCHYLSIRSIQKIKNKKLSVLKDVSIYPTISNHTNIGIGFKLNLENPL